METLSIARPFVKHNFQAHRVITIYFYRHLELGMDRPGKVRAGRIRFFSSAPLCLGECRVGVQVLHLLLVFKLLVGHLEEHLLYIPIRLECRQVLVKII